MKTVTLMAYNLTPKNAFLIRQYAEKLKELGIPFTLALRGDATAILKGDAFDSNVEYIFFGLDNAHLVPYRAEITYYLSRLNVTPDIVKPSNVVSYPRAEYIQEVCVRIGLVYKPFMGLIDILNAQSKSDVLDTMLGLPRSTFDEVLTYLRGAANVEYNDLVMYERFIHNHSRNELLKVIERHSHPASLHGVDITWCTLTPSLMTEFNKDKSIRKPLTAVREPIDKHRVMLHVYLPPKDERTPAQHSMVDYLKRLGAVVYSIQARLIIDPNTDLNSL